MARLGADTDGTEMVLRSTHRVGRNQQVELRLSDARVSSDHAAIYWTGETWVLRDLGSRNGTYVDGRRLEGTERVELAVGARLGFAGPDRNVWRVMELEPPTARATDPSGTQVLWWRCGMLVFPREDGTCVYQSPNGQWLFESPNGCAVVHDGDTIEVAGDRWRLELPVSKASTVEVGPASLALPNCRLSFSVSADEEYVELRVTGAGRIVDLGARAHNYVLLTLARLRQREAQEGIDETAAGWITRDEMVRMLNMEANALNVQIHRIREQFRQVGIVDSAHVVERRPGTGLMRIGTADIEIAGV